MDTSGGRDALASKVASYSFGPPQVVPATAIGPSHPCYIAAPWVGPASSQSTPATQDAMRSGHSHAPLATRAFPPITATVVAAPVGAMQHAASPQTDDTPSGIAQPTMIADAPPSMGVAPFVPSAMASNDAIATLPPYDPLLAFATVSTMPLLDKAQQARTEMTRMMVKEQSPPDAWQPVVKRNWTAEEDELLAQVVARLGPRHWSLYSQHVPNRTGKQCRERWFNHLKPSVSKEKWSPEEDALIADLVLKWGTVWSKIAKALPNGGRTDNAVKNRWNSTMRKQLRDEMRKQKFAARAGELRHGAAGTSSGGEEDASGDEREELDFRPASLRRAEDEEQRI